ncbi:hypothetical protein C8F04DRAFT_1195089 [Mycena alexandri]|uniref:Uncharacterized protein n=1 Tax=Mycena alexandri TaxID=1745969 RepID=A0AAD6WUR6_9AGAR|nr:hypothetical protein C8F04DRAFT_1195089 [Mycena alexandri]
MFTEERKGSFNATTNNTRGVIVGAGGGSVAAGARHARTDFLGGEGKLESFILEKEGTKQIKAYPVAGTNKDGGSKDEFKSKAPRLQKKETAYRRLVKPLLNPTFTPTPTPTQQRASTPGARAVRHRRQSAKRVQRICAVRARARVRGGAEIPRASLAAVAVHRAIRRRLGVVDKVHTSNGRLCVVAPSSLHPLARCSTLVLCTRHRPAHRPRCAGVLFVKPVKYVEGEKGNGLESNEQNKTHPAGKHTNPLAISVGLALPAERRAPHGDYDRYAPAGAKSAYRIYAAHARAHAPACSVGVWWSRRTRPRHAPGGKTRLAPCFHGLHALAAVPRRRLRGHARPAHRQRCRVSLMVEPVKEVEGGSQG